MWRTLVAQIADGKYPPEKTTSYLDQGDDTMPIRMDGCLKIHALGTLYRTFKNFAGVGRMEPRYNSARMHASARFNSLCAAGYHLELTFLPRLQVAPATLVMRMPRYLLGNAAPISGVPRSSNCQSLHNARNQFCGPGGG